jgi:hypothetical protein
MDPDADPPPRDATSAAYREWSWRQQCAPSCCWPAMHAAHTDAALVSVGRYWIEVGWQRCALAKATDPTRVALLLAGFREVQADGQVMAEAWRRELDA